MTLLILLAFEWRRAYRFLQFGAPNVLPLLRWRRMPGTRVHSVLNVTSEAASVDGKALGVVEHAAECARGDNALAEALKGLLVGGLDAGRNLG